MSTEQPRSPLVTAAANAMSIVALVGLSVATFAYTQALEPLYGFSATSYHLNKLVWAVCVAAMFGPTPSMLTSLFAAGALLFAAPQTSYWAAAYTGRMGDPVWGPIATHVAVIIPILYFGLAVVKGLQKDGDPTGMSGAPMQAIGLPVCRMAIMAIQDLWPIVLIVRDATTRDTFVYLGSVATVIWLSAPLVKAFVLDSKTQAASRGNTASESSNLLRFAVLPLLPYLFQNLQDPTLPKPLQVSFTHPEAPLRILSSVKSAYSGVVVVGEVTPPTPAAIAAGNVTEPHSMRYLRAGHSLLGGVWVGDRVYRKDGSGPLGFDSNSAPIGDSVYGAFVTQEAARFIQRKDPPKQQSALMIGLGTGIATSAFMRHKIVTTIVEIDANVYDAAKTYFGLPPHEADKVHIKDGRSFVARRARGIEETELYDYVIHDLFSGGGVPGHMFTLEFWQDLEKIMKADGIVAVNIAAPLHSDSTRAVYLTLKKVFPQCRVYHDSMQKPDEEHLKNDFVNWIFFCTPSNKPINFRPAVEADFLDSFLRQQVLSTLPTREINPALIVEGLEESSHKNYILTDRKNPLSDWQNKEALNHWKLMRQVLPDVYWETY